MVADRHRLAAYYNNHCWRAFRRYQHRWSWTTVNPQNRGFSEFFAILGYGVHWASEFSLKLLEIDKTTCVRNYTDAVARLMSISSDFLFCPRSLIRLITVCFLIFIFFAFLVPFKTFLRATAVPPGTAEARISYGNSVCLSVCPSRPGTDSMPG